MPSFETYKKLYGGRTQGQVRKDDSDILMEATWYEDTSSVTGYVYSQEYDDEFTVADNLHPEKSKKKIPVEVKFYEIEYNSLSKDEVGQHIEFKPSFDYRDVVPYYDKLFSEPLGAAWPDGIYIDLPDSKGIYHRYLCVDQYRRYANQFPSFIVLPCNHKLQWIYKNKKMESWCVTRSQNSYNSGIWTDYHITTVENQKITWLPYNSITKTIFYDTRTAISEDRETPVCWSCSKVEDMNVKGIARYTWKQDKFDEHNDFIERDSDGKLIGIWCDYYKSSIEPTEPDIPHSDVYSEITFSGSIPNMRINGSTKKLTVRFYNADGEVDFQSGEWKFSVDGNDVADLLEITTSADDTTISANQIRIKFIGDDSYIGKNLVVSYESDKNVKSSLTLNLLGL